MNIDRFDEIARDVAQLKEITTRLNKYMHVKVEISELNDNISVLKSSSDHENVELTKPRNLSEGIRMAIEEKGVATSTEIYNFFEKRDFDMNRKTKNTLRSLFSMMKKNEKIIGDAISGFKLKQN